jgi:hypothetical protein
MKMQQWLFLDRVDGKGTGMAIYLGIEGAVLVDPVSAKSSFPLSDLAMMGA